jgi:hypothetical protein
LGGVRENGRFLFSLSPLKEERKRGRVRALLLPKTEPEDLYQCRTIGCGLTTGWSGRLGKRRRLHLSDRILFLTFSLPALRVCPFSVIIKAELLDFFDKCD